MTLKPADIICHQMGGQGRLKAMIGAHDFFSDNNGQTLVFKFRSCRKANYIKITLNSMDTYDLEFVKIPSLNAMMKKNAKPVTVHTAEGIYNDMLKDVFESFTGLYLTLCPQQ